MAHKENSEDVTASTTVPIGWPDPSRPIISVGGDGSSGVTVGEGNAADGQHDGEPSKQRDDRG